MDTNNADFGPGGKASFKVPFHKTTGNMVDRLEYDHKRYHSVEWLDPITFYAQLRVVGFVKRRYGIFFTMQDVERNRCYAMAVEHFLFSLPYFEGGVLFGHFTFARVASYYSLLFLPPDSVPAELHDPTTAGEDLPRHK
jgi:hypothetical protein